MSGATALCSAAVLAIASLYTDAKDREIPNCLVVGLVIVWAFAIPLVPHAIYSSVWAALMCGGGALAAGVLFQQLGWLGGGDGKLMGALALWIGPRELGWWLLGTAVLGMSMVLFALARPNGDFRARGIPFAWAIVPPAAVLLVSRANSLIGI